MADQLTALADAGVSIWLDDLSRERLRSGNLRELIKDWGVVGVTTNPTIFAAALAEGDAYDEQLAQLKAEGTGLADAITQLTTDDVRAACDLFASTLPNGTGHGRADGRVSIEVEPGLAMDTEATVAQARQLHQIVGRHNLLVKIPATKPGLAAISQTIGAGISVNVTLIFGLQRYREVIDAYFDGLEAAAAAGHDLADIYSVASFFVSRVDTEVDARLEKIGTDAALALRGKAAVANARAAYGVYLESLETERWQALSRQGANPQRPLWASTGVKNPEYPDTMYVDDLVVPDTVNTMPEKTLRAAADHAEFDGDMVTPNIEAAQQTLRQVAEVGVDLDDVIEVLEAEGVAKFVASWEELEATVRNQLAAS